MTDELGSQPRRAVLQSMGAVGLFGTGSIASSGADGDGIIRPSRRAEATTSASDEWDLAVDTTNRQYFPTQDGRTDGERIVRSDTTDDVAVAYELPDDVRSFTARFHTHADAAGEIAVYESADGGDSWAPVETTVSSDGESEADWTLHQLSVSSVSEQVLDVKLVLTDGTDPWSPQLGHVSIDYLPDPEPEPPDIWSLNSRRASDSASSLRFGWSHDRRFELDHFNIYLDGEKYGELATYRHWHPKGEAVTGLEPGTIYTIGLSAVGPDGLESEVATMEAETHHLLVDDCSDLSVVDVGTDRERLTVDTTNTQYFQRPDDVGGRSPDRGRTDDARITRTDTEDADLRYEPPGRPQSLVVEFYRHEEHGGELLSNGRPARAYPNGNVRRQQAGGGWIYERHVVPEGATVLTITGGSKPWGSQIGHVELEYEQRSN